jgi:hypothetical protein
MKSTTRTLTRRKTSPRNCSNVILGFPVASNQPSQVVSSIGCLGSRVGLGMGRFALACIKIDLIRNETKVRDTNGIGNSQPRARTHPNQTSLRLLARSLWVVHMPRFVWLFHPPQQQSVEIVFKKGTSILIGANAIPSPI